MTSFNDSKPNHHNTERHHKSEPSAFKPSTAKPSISPPPMLANFQQQFGQYVRGNCDYLNLENQENRNSQAIPDTQPLGFESPQSISYTPFKPRYSPQRVTRLYKSLVFNNMRSFLDKCFPVCQSLISQDKWQHICQQFLSEHACHSPYFTQINQSFVDHLTLPDMLSQLALPPYFAQLAHYEWMELYVDIHHQDIDTSLSNDCQGFNEGYFINLNPTVQNLHYEWAVHNISADNRPKDPADSFFLVYRHPDNHEVQFTQINALTYALVDFIDTKGDNFLLPQDTTALIMCFAQFLGFEDGASLVEFGAPLLEQLRNQRVLYGSRSLRKGESYLF